MATKQDILNLNIHKLTQDQYDEAFAAGQIDPNAIYLTPEEVVDLSGYATTDELNEVVDEATVAINNIISSKAGGTEVTLNGTSKKGITASFYAPTDAGTNGYILKSNGSGAPTWLQTLPVTNGGTGKSTFTSGQALIGNGTGAIQTKAITDNTSAKAMSSTSTNLVSERSVSYAIAHLVDSAPETLNTLNELAAALGDDPNFATTVATEIGKKENAFSVLPIAKGGTGASGFTQNRPLFYNGTYLTSSSHYIEGQKLGVNTIYAPQQPFFVNGQVHFASGPANSCTTGTIHLPTYYRGSASTYITLDLGKRDKSRMIMIEIKGNGYNGGYPIHSMYQFYNFIQNGTWSILAYKGRCYGDPTGPLKIYYKEVTNDDGTTETRLMACLCPTLDANGNIITSNSSQTLDISIQYAVSHLDKVTMTTGTSDPSSDDSITILQTITPVDAVPISNGGTGATTFTANRLLNYNGSKLVTTNHYLEDGKLAINSTSAPTENLYVNGTGKITGAITMDSTATIAGATTVKTLTISDTTGIGHLNFSRSDAPNYIQAPYNIGVCIGSSLGLEKCSLVAGSNYISPGVTGGSSLGTVSNIWKQAFVEHYQLYDSTNKTVGGQFYTTNSTSTTAQPTYLMIGNSIATGTTGSRYGVLRLYGTGANYTDIRRSAETTSYTLNLPGGNGQLVYHTNDTQIGDTNLPVYVNAGGAVRPVSSVGEAYLSWGGKNFAGSFGPIDAALAPELGSNRLAYGHPNGITVEYSRDGGSTWIDYELHPQNKVRLVTPGLGSAVIVAGKGTAAENGNVAGNQNYQSRVVLSSALLPIYTALNKFIILAGTNGFANCWCTIEKKVGTTWTILADKVGISGWTGYNVINIPNTVVGTGSGQASEIRLTFGGTGQTANSQYSGLGIYSIAAFGGMGWTAPSTLAKVGRIYSLDATTTLDSTGKPIPIVTFPSQVKISDTTTTVNTTTGALVVSGGAGIGGDIRIAGNAVVTGKIVAGTNGTVATTNKLTVYGQSQFNGNTAITGTLNVDGATTVKTLTISDTNAIGHLNFSRTGAPNYVIAPDKIAFNIGSSLSLETCALVVASNYVVPGASKYSTLGTESNLWKGVYAANVRANSFDAKGIQENQIRVWHSESETDALYLFGNQDGRRGLFDMDIGSIISIGPDYVNFNSYRSAGSQWARGREVAPFRSTFVPDRTFNDYSAFFPILSRKTKLGSWEAGCLMPGTNDYNANNTYNAGSQPSAEHNKLFYEAFHFVHTYDDTYTSNTHTVPLRIFGNGLVHAQKLGVTAAGGYGTGNPPTGTADDPLFVGQLYFKIIE